MRGLTVVQFDEQGQLFHLDGAQQERRKCPLAIRSVVCQYQTPGVPGRYRLRSVFLPIVAADGHKRSIQVSHQYALQYEGLSLCGHDQEYAHSSMKNS